MNLRELMLDKIYDMQRFDGFDRRTMRWKGWWFHPERGVQPDPGKKHRSGWCHLSMVSERQFAELPDEVLLNSYSRLLMISFKQM